ncbi:MAG: sulfatase-like hydrolase/transferase [Candidatus Aminicenantes bacterium]|nr:sulfatase-like hydrolase/transferase [Candidatus Aminicenantes bacterium]
MYNRREFLKLLGAGSAFFHLSSCSKNLKTSQNRPNIVLIFTDDQGYSDVGCFGAQGFDTPNLDKMAENGMRFTSFYVPQAVCSASRAGLLTGCYPNRIGIRGALGPNAQVGLHSSEVTIAEILKTKGYTTAIFGKWHLGHHLEFLPLQHGFDEYFGLPYSNDMWPVNYDGKPVQTGHKSNYPPLPLIENNHKISEIRTLQDQAALTTLYTQRAVEFIERNQHRPFFLYVPHSMPHVPLGVSDKFRGQSRQGLYGDVIMEIDWSVGQIIKALKRNRLENKTLVIFTSDNGPWMNYGNHAGSTGPLREGKGTSWEGGVRVPCIMQWPHQIPSDQVCLQMASTIDILPTIAEITGASLPDHKIDGVSVFSLLRGNKQAHPRDHFYYYYTHKHGYQLQCVRQGKWKLHFPHSYRSYQGVDKGMDGHPGPYARGKTGVELYNLEKDIGENTDVASQFPDVVKRLKALGEKARQDLGDMKMGGSGVRPSGRIQK